MNDDITIKEAPFDSFRIVYKILVWAGFYTLSNKTTTKIKLVCHRIYMVLAFLVCVLYNMQHIMFIVEINNDEDLRLECLMTEIPQINLLSKYLTLNLQHSAIQKINELLADSMFSAKGVQDEDFLVKNRREINRLSKFINIAVTVTGLFWSTSHIARRIQNESAVIPFYVPFKTDSWAKFILAATMPILPLMWVGYGHMALDCQIAAYYAQANVQLKIIKFNLEQLFFSNKGNETDGKYYDFNYQYRDIIDKSLENHFVYCVKRYEKLVWYTNEVSRVFNPSMTFQFFTSSTAMCLVIYKMSKTNVLSVPFVFLFMLYVLLLTQVFMYCYYGNLVTYESRAVTTSLYMGEWESLSPRFRRQLLIATARWSRPLEIRVAGVIPLSLNTFVSIIRFSYTLYTVLATKHLLTETLE